MTQMPANRGNSQRKRRGGALGVVLGLLGLTLVLGVGWFILGNDREADSRVSSSDLYVVQRGSFDITIPASGEFTALRQVEIRNPLETRAVITYIAPEGTTVKEGDLLVRFADEDIRNQISERELAVLSAENSLSAAENELSIVVSRNTSNLSQAQTDVELAEIAYEQWEQGTVVSRRRELVLALETAERNLDRLTQKLVQSKALEASGFISKDELQRDEIAQVEAVAALEMAQLNQRVYEEFQYRREQKERQAAVDRAREELDRVLKQNKAEFERAESNVTARRGELENRAQMLAYWRDQLSKAEIRAPGPGLVVYGSSLTTDNRNMDRQSPEIGSEVRRNDRIIVLPDVSRMTADVQVHESVSGRVQRGQRARVVSDTNPDTQLSGSVTNISVLAAGGGWRDPNRRDYTVRILLEDFNGLELKPSMRCKAEIYLDRVDDAIHVPIQAAFRRAGKTFVYVAQSNGFAQREIRVGRASESRLEIVDGLREGERVLLREPRDSEIVERLQFSEQQADNGNGNAVSPLGTGGAPTEQQIQPADGGERRRPGGAGGGAGGMDPAAMISQFDADGDGRLSREELPEQMQSMFDRLDANQDGFIDLEEIRAVRRPGG